MILRQLLVPISVIVFFFFMLFLFIKLVGPIPFAVSSVSTTKSDVFTVTGEGVSTQKPDTAYVNIGVTSDGATVQLAQDGLNKAINDVSAAVKGAGVSEGDIQTQNYSINPKYDFTNGQRITGYTASTNLAIKVTDVNKVNAVIDAGTANGANQVSGISFDVEDREGAENEAREKAVDDAKKKAEDAARIAGFRLGNVINYSESFGGSPGPIPYGISAPALSRDAALETKVEPGTNEIKVFVNLSYQIL